MKEADEIYVLDTGSTDNTVSPVSYTHLDVYKRQVFYNSIIFSIYTL